MDSSGEEETHFLRWHLPDLNIHNVHLYSKALFLLLLFISLAILIAALFLYAQWVVRRSLRVLSTTATPAAGSLGLDPTMLKSLPVVVFNHQYSWVTFHGNGMENEECAICLGVFDDGEKLKVLPGCKHVYHSDCLDTWLSSRSTCPICRASLQEIPIP